MISTQMAARLVSIRVWGKPVVLERTTLDGDVLFRQVYLKGRKQ